MALPSLELGPYQLHERIGEGGNGQVYRATGPLGTVAVKLSGNPNDFDDATLARVKREIAALEGLAHPSLITLLDHGVDPELGPYLVLPLLAGQTLRDLWKGRAVCPEAALLVILPIAEATSALHARGFVHRDLKPENAIATPDGAITVIDLGLAWGEHMTRHTESGAAVGSIGYMSPEQLDGQQVTAAADVWAIAVMLYEAIVGKRPFARARPTEEVAATLLGSYSRLTAADRRASEELADLVASCLALDATKRPSIDALVEKLRAQIDWTEDLATERAAAIADPAGYQQRISAFRVRRLERVAREAIEAGKPLDALSVCDRGLAYAPDHAALVELITKAESATAGKPKPVAAEPATRQKSSTQWIVGATLVGVAAIFAFAWYQNQKQDPWKVRTTPASTSTATSSANESDKALVRDFVGLFSKALDSKSAPSPSSSSGGSRPTTATGWFELAKTQEPAESVESLRHALTLSPDWPAAQDALCVALAATKDEGAIDICTKSVKRDPANVTLHAARGVALVNASRHAEALADLDAVVAADPAPKWRRLRATARASAGDEAGAKKDLADACTLGDAIACQSR